MSAKLKQNPGWVAICMWLISLLNTYHLTSYRSHGGWYLALKIALLAFSIIWATLFTVEWQRSRGVRSKAQSSEANG